ncbi:MAG: helix-turn-helix domain-containing protein [Clostridia bacterium]|nr:helix-turn-helix domain-containing protein [Clostridia bacterium]
MNRLILEQLSQITEEERRILNGGTVDKSIYTDGEEFTIKSSKILGYERFIEMRPHTRFTKFPKHKHNYIEMIYNCKGKTSHVINGSDEIVLDEDEILLLGTDAVHEVGFADTDDIAVNFIIKPEFFNSTVNGVGYGNAIYNLITSELFKGGESFIRFDVKGMLPVKNLIENLIWSFIFPEENSNVLQNMTMGLLFAELTERAGVVSKSTLSSYEQDLVLKVVNYIESSYKDARLLSIAEELKVSVVYLSKLVKNNTGKTFKDLLQEKRISEAEKLIINSKIPITEIIFSVGYENTNFFYKMFSLKYGCTPKEYRKNMASSNKKIRL